MSDFKIMSTSLKTKFSILALSIVILALSVWIVHQKVYTLSSDEFAKVYVELAMAYETSGSDASKWVKTKDKILKEHHLTIQEINRFIVKSNQHPEKWAVVWENIMQRLEQKQQKLSNPAPSP